MEGISFLMAGTLSVTLFENSDKSFKVDDLVKSDHVTPAEAGVQTLSSRKRRTTKSLLDSRFRGNDK